LGFYFKIPNPIRADIHHKGKPNRALLKMGAKPTYLVGRGITGDIGA